MMVANTYVSHGERTWNVSTINRESSAIGGPIIYAETMVWEWCPKTMQRIGGIVHQSEDCRGCISVHMGIVLRIHESGAFWE